MAQGMYQYSYGETDNSFHARYGKCNTFQIEIEENKYGYTPNWFVAWRVLCYYRSNCKLHGASTDDWSQIRRRFRAFEDQEPDNYFVTNTDGRRVNLDTEMGDNMAQTICSMNLFRLLRDLAAEQKDTPSPKNAPQILSNAGPAGPHAPGPY